MRKKKRVCGLYTGIEKMKNSDDEEVKTKKRLTNPVEPPVANLDKGKKVEKIFPCQIGEIFIHAFDVNQELDPNIGSYCHKISGGQNF